MAVAIDQHYGFRPFSRSQRCRLQSFTQLDYNILDLSQTNLAHPFKQSYEAAGIHRSFSTPCLSVSTHVDEEFYSNRRIEIVGGRGDPGVRALVVEVAIAMASDVEPMPVSSGLGGAYFLRGRNGDIIAVAKPIDEEPLAFNNPKGFAGLVAGQPGLKRSVRVGETGIRELAAYLLDHDGYAGVPPTALVKMSHTGFNFNGKAAISPLPYKIASLQRFVGHEFDAGELGFSGFSVPSIHRIGILDVRLLNLDRHAGNILIKEKDDQYHDESYAVGAAELVPIDHGLCLPEWLDDPYFEWLHWPQASVPFSDSELDYICNLDPYKDAEILRTELPSLRESAIRVLVLCTIFLKRAADAGLCLADIGEMMTREFSCGEENQSVLETICAEAMETIPPDEEDDNNQIKECEQEDCEMFEFDNESEEDCLKEVVDIPELLKNPPKMSKPPKIPRFSSAHSITGLYDSDLSPLHEEIHEEKDDDCKLGGCLTKSVSFSIHNNYNAEARGITFEDMAASEWQLFLERFEKLLPQVFEGAKSIRLKQRLGTSCKF